MTPEGVVEYLVSWLRDRVKGAGKAGVTVGVSGGVDSAVTVVIAKRAFPDNVMALMLPIETELHERIHFHALVDKFNIPNRIVNLDNVYKEFITLNESYIKVDGKMGRLLRGNIKSRLRMLTLYYSAQARDYLVLGTSNKSEITVGYTTKYGDAAVDLQILGDLVKSQVYELAEYLEIPEEIIKKTPSGGLWPGQTDEEELGFTYQALDCYITTGEGEFEVIEKIEQCKTANKHKTTQPPVAVIPQHLLQK